MWASKSSKEVELNRFESKSSGIDSGDEGVSSDRSSEDGATSTSGSGDSIAIIGSGDFGRGLALRMVQSGLTVYMGSRNPSRNA